MHLETALKGVIIPDRFPKSAIDVSITVLEAENDFNASQMEQVMGLTGIGAMSILSAAITTAAAALADARIDCLDLLAGGIAAIVPDMNGKNMRFMDPCLSEHRNISSGCMIAYLPSRDEVVDIWVKGDLGSTSKNGAIGIEELADGAINAAKGAHMVLQEVVRESAQQNVVTKANKLQNQNSPDVEMVT